MIKPGVIALFGSGETSPNGGKIYDWMVQGQNKPLNVCVLETPAGFELNSEQVAGRVGAFIQRRLQNYDPQVTIIPARKKGGPFSPDNIDVVKPMLSANMFFLGPGSPTYAVRQLQNTLAWHLLSLKNRQGALLAMASAATIASGRWALPVYEIYKVGDDPFWIDGLDYFGEYGLSLAFIPHWNNAEGGSELDTSHCFMGESRFQELIGKIPPETTIVGIDEHTALIFDLATGECVVMGRSSVHILKGSQTTHYAHSEHFPIGVLGEYHLPFLEAGLPPGFSDIIEQRKSETALLKSEDEIPESILALLEERNRARDKQDWKQADVIRDALSEAGWRVVDTREGSILKKNP